MLFAVYVENLRVVLLRVQVVRCLGCDVASAGCAAESTCSDVHSTCSAVESFRVMLRRAHVVVFAEYVERLRVFRVFRVMLRRAHVVVFAVYVESLRVLG